MLGFLSLKVLVISEALKLVCTDSVVIPFQIFSGVLSWNNFVADVILCRMCPNVLYCVHTATIF